MARPPSRSTTPVQGKPWHPPSDASTYRDLLLFEERLKTNAARLRRKKRRYQLFLLTLVFCIAVLASDVLLATSLLTWPANRLMAHLPISPQQDIILPTYITHTALLVVITTLVLFYASGLYAEKIGYANRYVPHANKALRAFNMYLNVRAAPLAAPWPFSILFGSPPPIPPSSTSVKSQRTSKLDPSRAGRRATPISPIPPSSNPRGELIFNSRVDKQFRESYERYRAAFERKRDERVLADAAEAASAKIWTWLPGSRGKAPGAGRSDSSEKMERWERGNRRSPSSSRSTTPVIGSTKAPSGSLRKSSRRAGSSSPPLPELLGERAVRHETPPPADREECFSFLLGDEGGTVDNVPLPIATYE